MTVITVLQFKELVLVKDHQRQGTGEMFLVCCSLMLKSFKYKFAFIFQLSMPHGDKVKPEFQKN